VDENNRPSRIVTEIDLLRGLQSAKVRNDSPVGSIAKELSGLIYPKARIEELYRIFDTNKVAVVVDSERLLAIVTKIDVIDYLSKQRKLTV
jgi:cystathionine beta-synthase